MHSTPELGCRSGCSLPGLALAAQSITTDLGYALPRLERRLGPVAAATLVAAAWALQHAVMPVLPGRR
jgi:hypothetical protein